MAETQMGIRKWLTDNGYKDDEITYDNNAVKVRNKYFTGATPQADGSTYDTNANLQRSLQQYQTAGRASQVDSLLNTATQKVNQPAFQFKAPGEFKFDAQSDPQYQAALRQAQQNAQTGGNNAMVALGSRGIGNSSITGDRVAQIQQKELGRVSDTVLPQLMQQAYQRYSDGANRDLQIQQANYGVGQDELKNVLGLANTNNGLVQQQTENDYRDNVFADKQKQDRIALANHLQQQYGVNVAPKMDTSLAYDQVAGLKPLDTQQFEQTRMVQNAGLTGYMPDGTETMDRWSQKQQLGISQQNANTSAGQLGWARDANNPDNKYKLWQMDPNNPDNQYKMKQIEEMTNTGGQKLQEESKALVEVLRTGDMSPATALQQIDEDMKLGFYTAEEAAHLKSIITQITPNLPVPAQQQQLTKDQQAALPSNAELDKIYKEQGNGAPVIDWKMWYRDPKGKSAGVDYKTWKQLYGPSLGPSKK